MAKKSLILGSIALAGTLLTGCGGGSSDDKYLPKSPLTEADLSSDFKFKDYQTKEEFDKDFEMISKKCSYTEYWITRENSIYYTARNLSREEKDKVMPKVIETYKKIDSFHKKCSSLANAAAKKQYIENWKDIYKTYPEYETLFGKEK